MKIGIDISQIVYGTGVSSYTKSLVEALIAIDRGNKYLLFGGSLRRRQELKKYVQKFSDQKNVSSRIIPLSPVMADILWNKIHKIPVEILTGKIDVLHSSDWTQPRTRAVNVTTVHDLVPLKFPERLPNLIIAAQKARLKWVKKESDLIIAVSKSTKRDLVELLGIPSEKIKVILEAPHSDVNIKEINNQKVEKIVNKYGVLEPYFLSVATLEPRKNISRVLEAMAEIPKPVKLVLVGRLAWGSEEIMQKIKKLDLADRVILTGHISAEELAALYKRTLALIYVSLYEGFGLPVITAMENGVPVITSNVSSLPEVGGKAAIYVDPLSTSQLYQAMERVINFERGERQGIIKKGLVQAKKFSWEKAARETLAVYEEAYKLKKG